MSRQIELKKRHEEEMDGCTFSPKTVECPAYVKRIAKSMAVVRAARTSTAMMNQQHGGGGGGGGGSVNGDASSRPQWN